MGVHDIEVPGSTLRAAPERQESKMLFTADHDEPAVSCKSSSPPKSIHSSTNGRSDIFPAHELFKKLGDLGFLGLNKPVEFGGQGLDYS
jgi:citronellyl-CoA dehydrogenase